MRTFALAFGWLLVSAVFLPLAKHLKPTHPLLTYVIDIGLPAVALTTVLVDLYAFRFYLWMERRREKKRSRRLGAQKLPLVLS